VVEAVEGVVMVLVSFEQYLARHAKILLLSFFTYAALC
jgi:hypothetical protein